MIRVTPTINLGEDEIDERFIRASGPGGQNVNKLSTAVQLRFDVRRSPSLTNDVALRLMRIAGKRLTKDGVLVLIAQNHRTQERNRADARERLADMIREALVRPVPRNASCGYRVVVPCRGRVSSATMRPRFEMTTASPVRSTSSRIARQRALNSDALMTRM